MRKFRGVLISTALACWLLMGATVGTLGLGVVRVFSVPNAGMAPLIQRGDWIFVNATGFGKSGPARGEVVVFRGRGLPTLVHNSEFQVKRVAGLPGDTLSIRDGRLFVNGRAAPELEAHRYEVFMYDRYLTNDAPSYTVPPGTCFVLGDNPGGSYDSRFFGPVPAENLVGRAIFRIWPWGRFGPLP